MSSTSIVSETTKVIVLTGASGFLGQHVLLRLLGNRASVVDGNDALTIYALHQTSSELGAAVSSYTAFRQSILLDTRVFVASLDLTSPEECKEWFVSLGLSSVTIDCCIHTAALSNPGACEKNPDQAGAINAPRHFLNGLYTNNPLIKIIALSTDQVYDGSPNEPYNEESPCKPCNVYGKTKVELEDFLLHQQKAFPNSTAIVLRSSIILGPLAPFLPDKAHSTFLHFCQSRMNNETSYFTDEIRSVIAVSDVVSVLMHMIAKADIGDSGIYCMGGPHAVSRHEIALAVLSYFQRPTDVAIPVEKASLPVAPEAVMSPLNIGMDSSKLVATTGVSSFLPLSEIVSQTFNSHNFAAS